MNENNKAKHGGKTTKIPLMNKAMYLKGQLPSNCYNKSYYSYLSIETSYLNAVKSKYECQTINIKNSLKLELPANSKSTQFQVFT